MALSLSDSYARKFRTIRGCPSESKVVTRIFHPAGILGTMRRNCRWSNGCLSREVGIARCRGVGDLDENAPDALLAGMDGLGVRGARINVSRLRPASLRRCGRGLKRIDARCAELGWHLDFLARGWLTEELLPIFAPLRCSFTIAHMGMFRAEAGPGQRGYVPPRRRLRLGEADRDPIAWRPAQISPTPRQWPVR
jgi:hypothetical protein